MVGSDGAKVQWRHLMDAVDAPQRGPIEPYADAMAAFDNSVSALRDSAELARLTGDPAAPALEAMVRVLGASARQFQLRDRERKEIAAAMDARGRRIADEATSQIQASGTALIERLAPDLSRLVERLVRQRLWTIRLRSLVVAGGVAATLSVTCFTVGYGIAYRAGHNDGLLDSHAIAAAMGAGPDAANAWAKLMAANDPVRALKACDATGAHDGSGRRYCLMPVWLEPPPPPQSARK